jgi:hypothetical protein
MLTKDRIHEEEDEGDGNHRIQERLLEVDRLTEVVNEGIEKKEQGYKEVF